MAYLEEFSIHIANHDVHRFLQLWEEYCTSDTVEPVEYKHVLEAIKNSEIAESIGGYVEAGLPLWSLIQDEEASRDILRLILDIQTTNSPVLADTAFKFLKEHYGDQKFFNTKMRLIGLRDRERFQRAITNYELLSHMDKGKFVFHTAGWGTGEIMEISLVREQLIIEFENVMGRRDLSFENAFKTLVSLPDTHFLARRFANPDKLEEEARKDSVQVVKDCLLNLGPKTAAELKEEFHELVIPPEEWSRWWQATRTKLKKDTYIIPPSGIREPFRLRTAEVSHEEQLASALEENNDFETVLLTTYNFVRDLPDMLKNEELRAGLIQRFIDLLSDENTTLAQQVQASIFLEGFCQHKQPEKDVETLIQEVESVSDLLAAIPILAFKKRALQAVHDHRSDWVNIFLKQLLGTYPSAIRDYLLKELQGPDTIQALEETILDLLTNAKQYPEVFVWYFQKIAAGKNVPFSNKEGQCKFFEAFLTLYHYIENNSEYRDLIKKMYNLMSAQRWQMVRDIIEDTSLDFCKEFVLLASKCQAISTHDMKILRSLAQVVHPELKDAKKKSAEDASDEVIWTTEEGYNKTCERVRQIGEEEIVENAKEIEAARSHGDLRENSEYKYALERRSRLQGELKTLSDQLGKARIITPEDIIADEAGVGVAVEVAADDGTTVTYTILGPWDADPDHNILSVQSRLAQTMLGLKEGDKFSFNDDEFKVLGIRSVLQEQ
ncbi:Transcription elongation factor GreA [Chlamydiales bacterium SCGC AG-110-P3]|nr:Transcription elongation factor GreA [Chlamydiales bacterium SCGC AG-110-P3]